MSKRSLYEWTGATPGKLALVGVLILILVGVLVVQFSDSGSTEGGSVSLPRTPHQGTVVRSAVRRVHQQPIGKPSGTALSESIRWPKLSLSETLSHNPFEFDAAFALKMRQARGEQNVAEKAAARRIAAEKQAAEHAHRERLQREAEERRAFAVRAKKRAQTLSRLRQLGVSAVYRGRDGWTALLDGQVVKPGDVVAGHRVARISEAGVELEPVYDQ